ASTPTGLTAVDDTAAPDSQIDLSWTAVGSSGGFEIDRSNDGTTYTAIATTTATTYHDATVSADTTYSYQVLATALGGNSSPTIHVTRTTTPSSPINLSGSAAATNQVN